MTFSYNWICELVDGLELTPPDLERLITMKTAECEGIEEVGALLTGASAASTRSWGGGWESCGMLFPTYKKKPMIATLNANTFRNVFMPPLS